MSRTVPGPLDAAAGFVHTILTEFAAALTPIDGGAAAALAVVLLTAAVRLVLIPLSVRQAAAQRAQAKLAPELQQLRTRHHGDPARLSAEMTALYRRENVSPFGSLLPGLLQLPAVIALYSAFTQATVNGRPNTLFTLELFGTPLGTHGLAAGWPLLALLAAIAVVATVTSRRMRHGGGPAWLSVLPYLTLVPAATMPLAAGLYLLTTTAWSAAETAVLRRDVPARDPKEASPQVKGGLRPPGGRNRPRAEAND